MGEIEAVLAQHESVREAAVIVGRNNLGETLIAYLVIDSETMLDRSRMRHFLKDKLPKYAIPSAFVAIDIFPQTTSGKINYRALSNYEIALITPETNSATLLDPFRKEAPISNPSSFVPIQIRKGKPPIFCLHVLGSGLEHYLPLIQYFSHRSFYGLSSEMSGDPNAPHPRDINALADYYLQDIETLQPQGSYTLLGVSFGGVIAYEVAQRLVAKGKQVNFLGLFDTHCPDGNQLFRIMPWQERITHHFTLLRQRETAYIFNRLQHRWQSLQNTIKLQLSGSNESIDRLESLDSNYTQLKYLQNREEHELVNQNYQMLVYPHRVTLFRATQDTNPKLDWQQFTGGGLEMFDVPEDHLEILQEPSVKILVARLKNCLNEFD